ncbi:uncharacterized protein V6R79_022946 [Siganus canaliculatus]
MPLLVTDHSWTQTDSTIYISLPLKGARAGKVDIVSTEEYLKVHYPPYLFETFLLEPVDDARSTAKVGNGVVVISLPKKVNKVWEKLTITTNDKEKIKELREKALFKYQKKLSSESKSRAEKQRDEKKYALETMMKLENEERNSIQKMKDAERERTTAELKEWQQKQKEEIAKEPQIPFPTQRNKQRQLESADEKHKDTCSVMRNPRQAQRDNTRTERKKNHVNIPLPRPAGSIQVSFTPRVFPTALRESRVPEEEEWLKKQADARRAVNADVAELADLEEKERNADWLKDKGDKCFAAGDYLGAVNSYSLAIRLNRNIPALYSNRAACHLKLRNLHKAIEDSTQVLGLRGLTGQPGIKLSPWSCNCDKLRPYGVCCN